MYNTIRTAIPRLLEVRDGILLKAKEDVVDVTGSTLLLKDKIYKLHQNHITSELGYPVEYTQRFSIFFDVIGHPITVLDVLEWLGKVKRNVIWHIDSHGFLGYDSHIRSAELDWGLGFVKVPVNLESPYLDDQPEEFMEFLKTL